MKVAFYVYPTAFQNPGGGEVQLLKTKEYLEKAGISVRLFDAWQDKLEHFDIFHVFGSVKDCLPMMELARRRGVKIVLSTICWYSWKSAWGTYEDPWNRAKSLARQAAKEFFPFWPSQRKTMIRISDLLLPNSESEARQIQRYFGVAKSKIQIVPNGVDRLFADARPELFRSKYPFKDFVLCVGRIEPRKNQLNMIRALSQTDIPLVIIGDPVRHYPEYDRACRRTAGKNVHFLGGFPHDSEMLRSAFSACNTFLLASWLETPGLAALEAGLAGAKVVITREGATREYFGKYAQYVAPDNLRDIRETVMKTLKMPADKRFKDHILKNYLWDRVAEKTLQAYRSLSKNA
ncbi:MAG TPA: glycosyltransferase [Candidatus Omnitrophota bacterium]|nr:glycosyltransferase [Candidatus Omnitrophota bacterium]